MTRDPAHAGHSAKAYGLLVAMAALSYTAMYVLMYAMVDRVENAVPNWNQAYMAGLMTAPMVVIELLVMRSMYRSAKANALVLGLSLVVGAACFLLVRKQTGIADRQFLHSMIPHHAAAILMCDEAPLTDAQVQDLCRRIRQNQQAEIDEMRAILERLAK